MSDANIPVTCEDAHSSMAAFLADEIPSDESLRIQAHLEACGACACYRRFEDAFDVSLRRGVRREAAPSTLIVRIHEALAAERTGLQAHRVARVPAAWRRWAVAAALLVLALAPAVILSVSDRSGRTDSAGTVAAAESVVRGTLVCGACERYGVPADAQKGCRKFGHHAAFRCPKTGLWEIVESDATRDLIIDADHLGDAVELRGVFLDDLHYVRVRSYTYLR